MSIWDADKVRESIRSGIADARAKGMFVVQGNAQTLLLDIDSDIALKQFDSDIHFVEKYFKVKEIQRWKSKSRNTHVMLECTDSLDVTTRIALQLALGSDPAHELLCLLTTKLEPDIEPCYLFRP